MTTESIWVGAGNISAHMLKVWKSRPDVKPAALVDVRPEALERVGGEFGIPSHMRFQTLGDALTHCAATAVIINTPSELHYEQTVASLDAGRHVLVAKPFTNNYGHAVELVRIAERKKLKLCVGQQIRYNRHYLAVADFVRRGHIGAPGAAWFMNSKPRPNPANLATMAQPSLFENACHHFDSFLAVFDGHVPEWIVCDGFIPSWSRYAGPCMVNAMIGFSGNLHVAYHGGFSSQAPMYEFRVEGGKGALRCRGIHMSNDTMEYEVAPALGAFQPQRIDEQVPLQDPFLPFLDAWLAYLNGGQEPPFSGRNNLKVFAMLTAAVESVETGKRVAIAGDERFEGVFKV